MQRRVLRSYFVTDIHDSDVAIAPLQLSPPPGCRNGFLSPTGPHEPVLDGQKH